MTTPRPRILVIDDDELESSFGEGREDIEVEVVHPDDVEDEALFSAHLVLVDYRLDEWPGRTTVGSPALAPQDGLAVIAVLRSHIMRRSQSDRPIAFALRSGHLDEISAQLPPEVREHAFARIHDLEWAFPKTRSDGAVSLEGQVAALGSAVRSLPNDWPQESEGLRRLIYKLLALSEASTWHEDALRQILDCHPPVHELASASDGLAFLRWFMHRVLPYPCFLWDEKYLAARLRVSIQSLSQELRRGDSELQSALEPLRYSGILSEFLGPRWWRRAVEDWVWEETDGRTFEQHALGELVDNLSEGRLEVQFVDPVVAVDHCYQTLPELVEIDVAARIQPDDWPPFAELAWTSKELARTEPHLRARVVREDREAL